MAITWMQRLKRVFNIDIETCERCAGQVKVIACIEDPAVIEGILAHLKNKAPSTGTATLYEGSAPPVCSTNPRKTLLKSLAALFMK